MKVKMAYEVSKMTDLGSPQTPIKKKAQSKLYIRCDLGFFFI